MGAIRSRLLFKKSDFLSERENSQPWAKPCCLFGLWAVHVPTAPIAVVLRRRGGNTSEDLSLFVLLYNMNFMSKLKFKDFFFKWKPKIIHWLYNFFQSTRTNHPTFHSDKRLVNSERESKKAKQNKTLSKTVGYTQKIFFLLTVPLIFLIFSSLISTSFSFLA